MDAKENESSEGVTFDQMLTTTIKADDRYIIISQDDPTNGVQIIEIPLWMFEQFVDTLLSIAGAG